MLKFTPAGKKLIAKHWWQLAQIAIHPSIVQAQPETTTSTTAPTAQSLSLYAQRIQNLGNAADILQQSTDQTIRHIGEELKKSTGEATKLLTQLVHDTKPTLDLIQQEKFDNSIATVTPIKKQFQELNKLLDISKHSTIFQNLIEEADKLQKAKQKKFDDLEKQTIAAKKYQPLTSLEQKNLKKTPEGQELEQANAALQNLNALIVPLNFLQVSSALEVFSDDLISLLQNLTIENTSSNPNHWWESIGPAISNKISQGIGVMSLALNVDPFVKKCDALGNYKGTWTVLVHDEISRQTAEVVVSLFSALNTNTNLAKYTNLSTNSVIVVPTLGEHPVSEVSSMIISISRDTQFNIDLYKKFLANNIDLDHFTMRSTHNPEFTFSMDFAMSGEEFYKTYKQTLGNEPKGTEWSQTDYSNFIKAYTQYVQGLIPLIKKQKYLPIGHSPNNGLGISDNYGLLGQSYVNYMLNNEVCLNKILLKHNFPAITIALNAIVASLPKEDAVKTNFNTLMQTFTRLYGAAQKASETYVSKKQGKELSNAQKIKTDLINLFALAGKLNDDKKLAKFSSSLKSNEIKNFLSTHTKQLYSFSQHSPLLRAAMQNPALINSDNFVKMLKNIADFTQELIREHCKLMRDIPSGLGETGNILNEFFISIINEIAAVMTVDYDPQVHEILKIYLDQALEAQASSISTNPPTSTTTTAATKPTAPSSTPTTVVPLNTANTPLASSSPQTLPLAPQPTLLTTATIPTTTPTATVVTTSTSLQPTSTSEGTILVTPKQKDDYELKDPEFPNDYVPKPEQLHSVIQLQKQYDENLDQINWQSKNLFPSKEQIHSFNRLIKYIEKQIELLTQLENLDSKKETSKINLFQTWLNLLNNPTVSIVDSDFKKDLTIMLATKMLPPAPKSPSGAKYNKRNMLPSVSPTSTLNPSSISTTTSPSLSSTLAPQTLPLAPQSTLEITASPITTAPAHTIETPPAASGSSLSSTITIPPQTTPVALAPVTSALPTTTTAQSTTSSAIITEPKLETPPSLASDAIVPSTPVEPTVKRSDDIPESQHQEAQQPAPQTSSLVVEPNNDDKIKTPQKKHIPLPTSNIATPVTLPTAKTSSDEPNERKYEDQAPSPESPATSSTNQPPPPSTTDNMVAPTSQPSKANKQQPLPGLLAAGSTINTIGAAIVLLGILLAIGTFGTSSLITLAFAGGIGAGAGVIALGSRLTAKGVKSIQLSLPPVPHNTPTSSGTSCHPSLSDNNKPPSPPITPQAT
jgi:hypothetical protein